MDCVDVVPAAPYDLLRSARGGDGPSRRVRDGAVELRLRDGRAVVRQRADGSLRIGVEAADPAGAVASARWLLACDEPVAGLVAAARGDALLGPLVRRAPGLRALRVETVAHAALIAFAGQLITAREARQIERRVVACAVPVGRDGLAPSPTAAELLALGSARLVACGLAQRRADALLRLLRVVDLERLRDVDADLAAARVGREPGVGPWTVGVLGLHGYGWADHGLVGDLGLMRLASELRGRPAQPADTADLLAPYAPWRGLASVHLLGHPLARRPSGHLLAGRGTAPLHAGAGRTGSAPETI